MEQVLQSMDLSKEVCESFWWANFKTSIKDATKLLCKDVCAVVRRFVCLFLVGFWRCIKPTSENVRKNVGRI